MSEAADPVFVLARITAQPGKEDAVRDALQTLVGPTRLEEGNISYDLTVSSENPAEFVTVERWKSAAALPLHMQQKYVTDAIAAVGSLLAAPPSIVTYTELSDPA
jgi:quinol monooxygenase YgiN